MPTEKVNPDGVLLVVADRFTGCEIDLREFMADLLLLNGPLYSGASQRLYCNALYCCVHCTCTTAAMPPAATVCRDKFVMKLIFADA
ncbi:hypothetical protein JK2ML_1603 [Mycobacterium leprae Kyoto-2]|uniref:Uncharacterized protein n=3 Tax=Mycobacterium leprae TaxID=1769 RepID=Q9CBT8_MYCLE|nr:hypothetical protein DIJ64_08790 [Mycobacterium leprae]OAR21649.1 hypothetical protein A8144_05045 [Mycobacterium leprae 3125609]OAX71806.1 hypothetical protein A3216_03770 [Mycobacterium leprae 7935681]CAR71698.1 hypothetical protein MLBr01603 [Mycobacterium leprae Br4923]BBC17269.1 hypothetical protein JK2ML_1603 [Mycobacterium leprae Kyoto-2]